MKIGGQRKLFSVLMLISGCLFIKGPAMAQDSLEVWKVDFKYIEKDSVSGSDFAYAVFADYGLVSLYYRDGAFKWVYTDSLYELGNAKGKIHYMVNGTRAEELLWPSGVMPDNWMMQDSFFYLWPKDYKGQWLNKSGEVAGLTIYPKIFSSSHLVDEQVLVYFTDDLPEAAWKPYSFLHHEGHGILGIFLTDGQGEIRKGIEATGVSKVKVGADFFLLPESLHIVEIIKPPKLNE
ncbi:hypothetical protein [Olivibacter sitiensis]|uniref:hypothetical protein n=1 Tax=Olivibacter sitiensis TaxID=376470 RepID=UPI00048986BD|nr:hypothetical protein [Olivibacter sitiensis]